MRQWHSRKPRGKNEAFIQPALTSWTGAGSKDPSSGCAVWVPVSCFPGDPQAMGAGTHWAEASPASAAAVWETERGAAQMWESGANRSSGVRALPMSTFEQDWKIVRPNSVRALMLQETSSVTADDTPLIRAPLPIFSPIQPHRCGSTYEHKRFNKQKSLLEISPKLVHMNTKRCCFS
ncbi:hypothetical protein Q5P01_013787 [Channa striata]|uniref:Uncharacterized protein n=1 Tax=Channa striata TaxID=64152 RepID=A0AA88MK07_CHASR|nr:hypothetical protein Q5P01_013787 [Channa striata]